MSSKGKNTVIFVFPVENAELQINTAENISFEVATDRFVSVREVTVTKYIKIF